MEFIVKLWNDENIRTIALEAPIRFLGDKYDVAGVAREQRRRAEQFVYDGDPTSKEFRRNAAFVQVYHEPTQSQVTFARDAGHHSRGGFKSPACERCYHLALSYVWNHGEQIAVLKMDGPLTQAWLAEFFGENVRHVWAEEPPGLSWYDELLRRAAGVELDPHTDVFNWHFRLFCDERWNALHAVPAEMELDLRRRGWVTVPELVFGKSVRRPFAPYRAARRAWAVLRGKFSARRIGSGVQQTET